ERDRALRPHPPRGPPHDRPHAALRRALVELRLPRSRAGRRQEGNPVRQGPAVQEPRSAGRGRGQREREGGASGGRGGSDARDRGHRGLQLAVEAPDVLKGGADMKIGSSFRVAAMGVVMATAVLSSASVRAGGGAPARVVAITARRFEFVPNEITLKKGETVTLRLETEDVTHGFFVRPLGIDEEIVPGHPTDVTVTPQQLGLYRTICDHFCGAGHGGMKMTIVVENGGAAQGFSTAASPNCASSSLTFASSPTTTTVWRADGKNTRPA